MSQKLSIKGFKWVEKLSKFNERFIKSYNENSDKGYFLEVDVEYARKLRFLHKDFPFSPERKKVGKVEKLVCDVENKIYIYIYAIHIRALKQGLNHGLVLKRIR